jgi:catechol 2,3-dioxygenase-like lactoylglutathione lyase family enzyme
VTRAPLVEGVDGVSHFGIQVADLERSVAFYRDLLGFELVARWVRDQEYIQELVGYPGVELHVAVFKLPLSDVFLEILEYRNVSKEAVDPSTANPGTAHLCLYVEDLDAYYQRLSEAGVAFVSAVKSPSVGPNKGGKAVYMIDPDGIRVELIETSKTLAGDARAERASRA